VAILKDAQQTRLAVARDRAGVLKERLELETGARLDFGAVRFTD